MADTDGSSERLSELRARWEADRRSRIFLQLAEEYRRQGQPQEAMAVLDEGLSRHPSSVAGKVLQGRCRLESGQAEAAAATLEEVVSRDPTHIVAYRWLTEAYLELGDTDQARRRLEIYTQLNPQGEDLPDLSRRLVALENDPARRLSVGSEAAETTLPPRPTPEVTEAPTTILPVPPELSGTEIADLEQPTVAVPLADVPTPPPEVEPAPPSEAPTTAVPLPDLGTGAPSTSVDTSADTDASSDEPTDLASEARTAKHRLESLGLVPHADTEAKPEPVEPPVESGSAAGEPEPSSPPEPPAGDGSSEEQSPGTGDPVGELVPPTEQPTGEIPWWRPRPASAPEASPWDTQEAETTTAAEHEPTPTDEADGASEPVAEASEQQPLPVSEAPTGIFDAASVLAERATDEDPEPAQEQVEAPTPALESLEPPLSEEEPLLPPPPTGTEEPPPDPAATVADGPDAGIVFPETPAAPAPSPPASVAGEPFADLLEPAVEPSPEPPLEPEAEVEVEVESGGFEVAGDAAGPATADVLGLDDEAKAETAEPPTGVDAGESRREPLFALDAADLVETIDLASVPTRPLSIPFWLTLASSSGRTESGRTGSTATATPTLAKLYLDQGHSEEAEALYGSLEDPGFEAVVAEPTAAEAPAPVELAAAEPAPSEPVPSEPPPAHSEEPTDQAAAGDEATAGAAALGAPGVPMDVEIDAAWLLGDYQPERGGLTAKQVYVLQRYLARLRGEQENADVS